MPSKGKVMTPDQVALAHGYRSGLEDSVFQQLKGCGVDVQYEPFWIMYTCPPRKAKYLPDFILPNGVIVETKGRFLVDDRQRHLILKEQIPDLDIRFVFTNPQTKISKTSQTTYGMWCKKHGFLFATKTVPQEWVSEAPDERRLTALRLYKHEKQSRN